MTLVDWGGSQRDRNIQADRHLIETYRGGYMYCRYMTLVDTVEEDREIEIYRLIDTYRGGYMYRYMTLVDWGGRQRDRSIQADRHLIDTL